MTIMRGMTLWRISIALASAAFLVSANDGRSEIFGAFGHSDDESAGKQQEPLWEEVEEPTFMKPKGVPESFADLAEQVSPAVVNIRISLSVTPDSIAPNPFREFHGFPFEIPHPGFGSPSWGEGSGFVISRTGFIVTNAHVVEGADKIEVIFLDGKKLSAEIIGLDKKTDIALIKVEPSKPLRAIPLGNSDSVRPGQWVVAIGNAMSLEHTVTAGIVSAKHRFLARGNYDDFIQTDAAINPGNSGGPLINLAGEVIGINSAINPQANTIGFAVPINMAKQILPQLRETGHVTRSWLGVEIHELPETLKEEVGTDTGALVKRVLPATPALRAGLEEGDVIVTFNGKQVSNHRQLPGIVASSPIDREVEVEVLRDGEKKLIMVTLAAMEEPEQAFGRRPHPRPGAEAHDDTTALDIFGLDIQDLTPELAEQLELEVAEGVIVTRVVPGSAADDAGLERGDIILELEGDPAGTAHDFDRALAEAGEGVILLVRRNRTTLFVPLKRRS